MAFARGDEAVLTGEPRPLTAEDFEKLRQLAYEKAGLDLKRGKEQLVSARLGRVLRDAGIQSWDEYYRHVVSDRTGAALVTLLDALTTNHTSFFREPDHFEFLREHILPDLRTRPKIQLWSAACSSGEEPFTLAMCARDLGDGIAARTRILATDISTRVLEFAARATYPADRFGSVPPQQLRRHLLRASSQGEDVYRMKPELRQMVEFRRLNLMESFAHCGTFPVIFCRNVMIYFDRPTQEDLVNRLAGCLEPGGYLFIGHAETLNRINHPLRYIQPAVYRKPPGGGSTGVTWRDAK